MTFIAFLLLRLGVFMILIVISSPVLLGLLVLMTLCENHQSLQFLKVVPAIFGLFWFMANGWMAQQTASYMMFENKKLGEALTMSLRDVRFRLAFLPIVGSWFMPQCDEQKADNNDSQQ